MKCAFEWNREFDAVPKMVRSENEDVRTVLASGRVHLRDLAVTVRVDQGDPAGQRHAVGKDELVRLANWSALPRRLRAHSP
mgnify:CR=1 FL=1